MTLTAKTATNQERLERISARLQKAILEVLFSFDYTAFNNKLRQVIVAHWREVERKLKGDAPTHEYLEKLFIVELVALLLAKQHLSAVDEKKSLGKRLTRKERMITRWLSRALFSFGSANPDTRLCLKPNVDIATAIQSAFDGVTTEEANEDAATLRPLISALQRHGV
jgi:hypothetical protein